MDRTTQSPKGQVKGRETTPKKRLANPERQSCMTQPFRSDIQELRDRPATSQMPSLSVSQRPQMPIERKPADLNATQTYQPEPEPTRSEPARTTESANAPPDDTPGSASYPSPTPSGSTN